MGNKLSRRRRLVEERYTRPQGLYPIKDFDQKKLRKLILDAKLAPCYPGGEEQAVDLDECPICFLYYPSLNRSRCCMKGICTECFLQMKPPNSSRPTQCPFCKTPNYCVEYRGVKTQEEKIIEQVEEQKVIEAKIKIQQQEHKEENERIHKKQEFLHTGQVSPSQDIDYQHHQHLNAVSDSRIQTINPSSPVQNEIRPLLDGDASANVTRASSSGPVEDQLHHRSSGKMLTWSQPLPSRHNRDDDFDLDLEDIMVMEAIWQSIHESGVQRFTGSSSRVDYGSRPGPSSGLADCQEANAPPSEMSTSRDVGPNNSVTGGLACAIAALAERQVLNGDSSNRQNAGSQQNQSNLGECDSLLEDTHHNHTIDPQGLTSTVHAVNENRRTEEEQQSCLEERNDGTDSDCGERAAEFHTPDNWIEVSLESGRALSPRGREGSQGSTSDWAVDQSSEVVEVGTSFSSSIRSTSDMPWTSEAPQGAENSVDPSPFNAQSYVVPESYEEQIMLALAISLAEAQAQSC